MQSKDPDVTGKSVTLAVIAMLLSSLGFRVDVVCYSDYLSDFDFEAFQHMFMRFGLTNLIRYSSINKVCEIYLNNPRSIREGVSSITSSNNGINLFAVTSDARILLIDEVDVLFSYANTYKPFAKLCSAEITALVEEIWKVHKTGVENALTVDNIKKWSLYIACIDKYTSYESLIEESLKTLLGDLKIFDGPGHVYHVDSDTHVNKSHRLQRS